MSTFGKIHPLVKEKSFKGFSIFSSGGHLIQRRGTVLAILVEGHPRNLPDQPFWSRSHLKQKVDNARTTDDRQRPVIIAQHEHELKIEILSLA